MDSKWWSVNVKSRNFTETAHTYNISVHIPFPILYLTPSLHVGYGFTRGDHRSAPAAVTVIKWMLKVGALRNGFTYGKLFHQLEEIVSELLRYLWEIPSDAHQSFS